MPWVVVVVWKCQLLAFSKFVQTGTDFNLIGCPLDIVTDKGHKLLSEHFPQIYLHVWILFQI